MLTGLLVAAIAGWLTFATLTYKPLTTGGEAVGIETGLDLIGHAGAGLPEAVYSNSLEGLEAAASRGYPLVEVDLSLTSDGKIVAAHDFGESYAELRSGLNPLPPALARLLFWIKPDHAEFMDAKMRGGLTPVDVDTLGNWLRTHPAVRLVTDVKDNSLAILQHLSERPEFPTGQVIPQIYARQQLAPVRALGFGEVIYTLYRDMGVPLSDVIDFAAENDVRVTMPAGRATATNLAAFAAAGVTVYVHTINDPDEALLFEQWGASGVYTDFLVAQDKQD